MLAGMVPIRDVLTAKGMAPGYGAFSFLMAATGLSLSLIVILRYVIRIRLPEILQTILFVSFALTGCLFYTILG